MREIKLPLAAVFQTATGVVDTRRILLLEVEDADGTVAWSECVAGAVPGYGGESIDEAWESLTDYLVPLVLSRRFESPSKAHAALREMIPEQPMARASLEMATWAIEAKRAGVPLAAMLTSDPRTTIECGVVIGMQPDVRGVADHVRAAKSAGYHRIKLKVSPGSDIDIVHAAMEVVEPAILAVDANGSYTMDDPGHSALLRQLDSLDLGMIEQPIDAGMEDCAKLQMSMRTAICLDETIASEWDARAMIQFGSARIVNVKPGRVGGLTEAIAIHDVCSAAGIPVWCGGMLETGIGRAYNVALASLPNFRLPGDISPSARYWDEDIIDVPWLMKGDGTMDVPLSKAGIGVEPDMSRIDNVTQRKVTITAE